MSSDEEKEREPGKQEKEEESHTLKRRKRKRKRASKNEASNLDSANDDQVESTVADNDSSLQNKLATEVDRTVFIEGIPYNCTEQDIRDFFSNFAVTECRLPVWQDSGRLRGYGHVVFLSPDGRQKALQLSGTYLKNRYLTISPAKPPKEQEQHFDVNSTPSKTILLQNLSYQATEDDIQQVLEKFGTIADGGIRVVRRQQQSKGFAYVEFESIESAKKVVESKISIRGRHCRMDYDHGRVKGSFRGPNGRLWHKEHARASKEAN